LIDIFLIACIIFQFQNVNAIPSEVGEFLEKKFAADGFLLFIPTQGDTPSSFALSY